MKLHLFNKQQPEFLCINKWLNFALKRPGVTKTHKYILEEDITEKQFLF